MAGTLCVLGSCGAWPEPGRACSGFLLESDGTRVVLDLGYGTARALFSALDGAPGDGISAVIITHQHPDHMVDLHALLRERWYAHRGAPPVPLYTPEGVLARLVSLDEGRRATIHEVFDWHPIPSPPQQVGPFRLESVALPHYVPTAGVRLESPGLTVAYTGDTGPDPALDRLGRDADLYIVDATSRGQQGTDPQPEEGPELNLTALEAGRVAEAAGASRLMLTHFWPGNDRQASRDAAGTGYHGEILVAEEGLTVKLPGR
jgi:ribonuclease BN (tRNA processing enzyme)